MEIQYFGFNAFRIVSGDKVLAIDPGGDLWARHWLQSLLPREQWKAVTHVFVTHGDPDHYWHADRVAEASGASTVCSREMIRVKGSEERMLSPRKRGLRFSNPATRVHRVSPGETIQLDGMDITGIPVRHGVVPLRLGPIRVTVRPGPGKRVGWGAVGFAIGLNGRTIVNLGDTLLLEEIWQELPGPDILMVPIGGAGNVMDVKEAVRAVRAIRPRRVIPCHYDCAAFFSENANPADARLFEREVQALGVDCSILTAGQTLIDGAK